MQFTRLETEDLEIILSTLRDFAEREMPLAKRLEWDVEDHCPEALVKEMLSEEVGLHLVFIPEEYDGMGGGAYDVYRLSCEFAKIDLGMATAMLAVALGNAARANDDHETLNWGLPVYDALYARLRLAAGETHGWQAMAS